MLNLAEGVAQCWAAPPGKRLPVGFSAASWAMALGASGEITTPRNNPRLLD
jgi:hypothetical protein